MLLSLLVKRLTQRIFLSNMKKAITVDKLIEELIALSKDGHGKTEVFVQNPSKEASFDGVTNSILALSAKDDSEFIILFANGDIINL